MKTKTLAAITIGLVILIVIIGLNGSGAGSSSFTIEEEYKPVNRVSLLKKMRKDCIIQEYPSFNKEILALYDKYTSPADSFICISESEQYKGKILLIIVERKMFFGHKTVIEIHEGSYDSVLNNPDGHISYTVIEDR